MTGLLYVAIVALWAAVLIPMWLRRHDLDQARRIDRHRVAMGTLARFGSEEAASASDVAARRRRMILVTLGALVLLSGAAWVLGVASGVWLAITLMLLAAFTATVFVAQRTRKRDEALRAMERSAAAREGRRRPRLHVAPADDALAVEAPAVEAKAQPPMPTRAPRSARWDEVFDQTA